MLRATLTRTALLEFLRGVHAEGDAYKIALIRGDTDAGFDERTSRYAELDDAEVPDGQGYSRGGIELEEYFAALVANTASIGWKPPAWSYATISASGAVVYNASKDGRVLQVLDFGGVVTSTNGPFTVDLARTGQIQLSLEASDG